MTDTKKDSTASGLNQPLFQEQLGTASVPTEYVHPALLAERFKARPDPLLAELGGTRVEVAIGIDRTVYQLEVRLPDSENEQLCAYWVKADTKARRVKEGVATPLENNKVPVTLNAAINSLCTTFGLGRDAVLKAGVNLLAFWEKSEAGDHLEIPMSTDWARFSLANM